MYKMETYNVEDILKVYEGLTDFLMQDDFDEDLREELDRELCVHVSVERLIQNSETIPVYLQVLEMRKEDLQRMECGITITGKVFI
jgi:hypothetical protein